MESERFSISLPPSPGRHRANSPVQFSRGCLLPSLEALDTVSFRLKDFLYTMASRWPFPAYTELVEVLAHATEKLSLDWPDEPRKSQSSKLDECLLSGSGSRPTWKSRPLLPSKQCRTTSALIVKSYMVAGQGGAALHTMAILQAYQAEVLKEINEGGGVTPEAVKKLRRATDLALRATKHTARAVGRSMAGLVTAERHLWLNLLEIREK